LQLFGKNNRPAGPGDTSELKGQETTATNIHILSPHLKQPRVDPIAGSDRRYAAKVFFVPPSIIFTLMSRFAPQAAYAPEEYYRMVCDQFDTLYHESKSSGKIMALPLHRSVIGLPFGIKYLDKVLDYIFSHSRGWKATGPEIAYCYHRRYYRDPGEYGGGAE
jgi:hypothetical protein